MNQIEDYIIVKNTIPKDLCKSMVDECNTREWRKHQCEMGKQADKINRARKLRSDSYP